MASRSCPSSKRAACRDYCSFMALRQNDGATRVSPVDRERPLFVLSHDMFVCQSVSICEKPDCENRMATSGFILAVVESQWPSLAIGGQGANKICLRRNRRPFLIHLRVGGGSGGGARAGWIAGSR